MRISAKAEYAYLAVIALARRHHEGRPLPIREIAETQGIPATFLTQILLKLKGAGLVLSTRGSSGGYRLARAPEEIALIDILRVVDGYGMASEDVPLLRPRFSPRSGNRSGPRRQSFSPAPPSPTFSSEPIPTTG